MESLMMPLTSTQKLSTVMSPMPKSQSTTTTEPWLTSRWKTTLLPSLVSLIFPYNPILDAKDAIRHNPEFVKAYFRRGSAYVCLNQLDLAVKDFK
jgi:hypothetical protein